MYVGWAGGSDISDRWKVQTPGHMPNSFDAEQSFEDLHNARAKGVRLVNQSWADEDVFGDPYWCTDMRHFQTYTYQGGFEGEDYYPPFSISGSGNTVSEELGTTLLADATRSDGSCLESEGRRLSDLRELQFCEVGDYIKQRTYEFETSWNAGEPFFVGLDQTEDGAVLNSLAAVDILVDVPGIGLETVVKVPPPIVVQGSAGFDDPGVGSDELWGLMELSSCADTNEDGVFDSDDAALRFQWEPYVMPLADGDGIKASRTQVKFTITVLDIGWFGGVGSPIRATITVPDENEYDPVTELSTLEVPVWVMYQFPSVDASWGGESLVAGSTSVSWGDPTRVDYGYLVLTVDRTTEYTLEADGLDGDVVFAYSSGDFGFLSWSNPLDGDQPCADCNDNDGDGWIDADDPDCLAGELENNSELGKSTCNDGIDNDGDGLVDAEDDDCDDGSDIESTECGDQVDNDGDGWVDLEDLDCQGGLFEDNHTFGDFSCNDLIDNDGDGWFDRDDPACESADFDEDDGFTDAQCNDGIDNDGHGDVDSEDTMCAQRGASYEFEQRELEGECVDGEDNDLDGYTDSNDPDCEFNPWSFERRPFRDPLEYPGIDQCYDGVDNDEDGAADALDPGCWNAEGIADGFIDDESLAEFIPPPEDTGSAEDSGL
jgi:hypothetical protein